ncbi:MAG: DNA polymerase III subunit gamma/tau [Anaerolineae bacterium]|nr:DNA polymerase III subunit gamma/tau [Anaerolineae bacterium]
MPSQALYLKWRPMTFDEVVGQEHVTYTLRNALQSGRVGHAYLFSGPRGTGKTTMARLLAKAVNCLADDVATRPCNECQYCVAVNEGRFLDLIEIDAASHTGVDDVRELRDRVAFSPNEGRYKVYIIDEVHRFSGAAFDALLKTIEEPPEHAIFILATTEFHKVPQTIKSRCQRFDFRRLTLAEIANHLGTILEYEGIAFEEAALELIARQATGSMRDAISLLDQLIGDLSQPLTLDLARSILGTADEQSIRDLVDAIVAGDTAAGLETIHIAMNQGADIRQFANQMIKYLRYVMLAQTGGTELVEAEIMPDDMVYVTAHAEQYPRRQLLSALDHFKEAAADSRTGWQPQLPLEMAFIQCIDDLYEVPDALPVQVVRAAPPRPVSQPPAQAEEPPQAQEPIAQEAPSEPPAEPAISLSDVHRQWQSVLRMARQMDLAVEALLKSGKLIGIEGSVILYQMPSELLRDKLEGDENRHIIEAVLAKIYNQPLTIRASRRTSQTDQRTKQVDELLANDSLVSFAVDELGGSVQSIENNEE